MAHRPVGEERALHAHARRFHQNRCDRPVDIRLAGDGEALLIEKAVRGARHDADLILKRVPALDAARIAAVLLGKRTHRALERGDIFELFVRNGYFEILTAVFDRLPHMLSFRLRLLHLGGELGERHGRKLNVELFQKLPLVAHRRPEVEGARADLQNARLAECLHRVADSKEQLHAPLKRLVLQIAVAKIGEGNAEAAQHLARCKEPALAVAQAHAVLIGALVARTPQKNGQPHLLCEAGNLIFSAEVGVREKEPVHPHRLEFFGDLHAVVVVMQQPVRRNIVDIDELHAHFSQLFSRVVCILHRRGRGEDAPPRRRKSQNDLIHIYPPNFINFLRLNA